MDNLGFLIEPNDMSEQTKQIVVITFGDILNFNKSCSIQYVNSVVGKLPWLKSCFDKPPPTKVPTRPRSELGLPWPQNMPDIDEDLTRQSVRNSVFVCLFSTSSMHTRAEIPQFRPLGTPYHIGEQEESCAPNSQTSNCTLVAERY